MTTMNDSTKEWHIANHEKKCREWNTSVVTFLDDQFIVSVIRPDGEIWTTFNPCEPSLSYEETEELAAQKRKDMEFQSWLIEQPEFDSAPIDEMKVKYKLWKDN